MVEGSLLESATQKVNTQITWYFLATMIVYAFTLSMLIVGSTMLMSPQLKEQFIAATLVTPPPPPPPPPPPGGRTQLVSRCGSRDFIIQMDFVPPPLKSLSPTTERLPEVDTSGGVPGGLPSGDPRGMLGGVVGGTPDGVPDSTRSMKATVFPRPPELDESPLTKPRRISGGVLQGNAIRRVQPAYPPIALSARVSGSVQIEVVIDENGNVVSAEVVQGQPLLSQAALDAARQWKFRPTLLNGEPIKVTGVLIFIFRL